MSAHDPLPTRMPNAEMSYPRIEDNAHRKHVGQSSLLVESAASRQQASAIDLRL
jgi:hypothetical protein